MGDGGSEDAHVRRHARTALTADNTRPVPQRWSVFYGRYLEVALKKKLHSAGLFCHASFAPPVRLHFHVSWVIFMSVFLQIKAVKYYIVM